MKHKSLVYLQSGGPTPVINSSFYGLLIKALVNPEIDGIYGSRFGVEGLINDDLVDLRKEDLDQIDLLTQTPGAILGSSRKRIADDEESMKKIRETVKKHDIGYVFVNGGNDSMDTCMRLKYGLKDLDIKVIGIPKTIDNDLLFNDHTPGYFSSAKHNINALKGLAADINSYKKGKVTFVECMGRDTGWLAASTAILDEPFCPDLVYIPEMKFDMDVLFEQIKEIYAKKGYALIVVSEGLQVMNEDDLEKDSFGHALFEGAASAHLARMVKEKMGLPSREIDLCLLARNDVQNISSIDRKEAIAAGEFAFESALAGESGKTVCLKRVSTHPYVAERYLVDCDKIANQIAYVPQDWILGPGQLDKEKVAEYLSPLMNEKLATLNTSKGLPVLTHFKFIKA